MGLGEKILLGDVLSAARLIRFLEDEVDGAAEEMDTLYHHTGRAHVIGITGAPGVGKSTLVGCLIGQFRRKDMKVGVIAVDPSSPFSGGAILGDRVRMQAYGVDNDVFIRSLASRGWKGGLSRATVSTVHVMDAMGKDIILVEAVGSGQADIDITNISDTTILIMSPGAGDDIQMMKAGILEAADIFVINKADIPGAEQLRQTLQAMLSLSGNTARSEFERAVIMTEANCDKGIGDVCEALIKRWDYIKTSGEIEKRRREQAKLELTWAVEDYLRKHIDTMDQGQLTNMIDDLAQRKTNPRSVVREIIARIS
jgi:LAO/AO transport system kinase